MVAIAAIRSASDKTGTTTATITAEVSADSPSSPPLPASEDVGSLPRSLVVSIPRSLVGCSVIGSIPRSGGWVGEGEGGGGGRRISLLDFYYCVECNWSLPNG